MSWTTPEFDEIKMDAEIGSYQDDFDPGREVPAFLWAVSPAMTANREETRPARG